MATRHKKLTAFQQRVLAMCSDGNHIEMGYGSGMMRPVYTRNGGHDYLTGTESNALRRLVELGLVRRTETTRDDIKQNNACSGYSDGGTYRTYRYESIRLLLWTRGEVLLLEELVKAEDR